MVMLNPGESPEVTTPNHAAQHLLSGRDPLGSLAAGVDVGTGIVPIIVNGLLVYDTITNIINNYSTAASGAKVIYIPFGSQMANGITYAP